MDPITATVEMLGFRFNKLKWEVNFTVKTKINPVSILAGMGCAGSLIGSKTTIVMGLYRESVCKVTPLGGSIPRSLPIFHNTSQKRPFPWER